MKSIAAAVARSKSLREAVQVMGEAQREEMRCWKQEVLQEALEVLVAEHLGPRWQRRWGPTPWVCSACGPRDAQQLKRNGHYRRGLVVGEGLIRLRVPQLCCLECGKSVGLGALFLAAPLLGRPGPTHHRGLLEWGQLPAGEGPSGARDED